MKRRLLALCLVLALLLPAIPLGVPAEDSAYSYVSATVQTNPVDASLADVSIQVQLPEEKRQGVKELVIVAASYNENGQMLDSAYVRFLDPASGYNSGLRLVNTPIDSRVRIFLMDQDLQPLDWSFDAYWVNTVDQEAALDAAEEPEEPEDAVPETTEEMVPETTEETAPEAAEEPVPEVTEETAPAAPEEPEGTGEAAPETVTPEEAAEGGYYIAPEGARLLDTQAPEELAACEGTDTIQDERHFVHFTGLVEKQRHILLVSRQPGSLKPEDLLYIGVGYSDADGDFIFSYIPKWEERGIVQLYGPDRLTLQADPEYAMLRPGDAIDLNFDTADDAVVRWKEGEGDLASCLQILQTTDSTHHLTVQALSDAPVRETRSFYLEFVGSYRGQEAVTTVRVDLIPGEAEAQNAILGETAVTYNLYDREPARIPVFLDIPEQPQQPQTDAVTAAFQSQEGGNMIRGVAFTEDTDPAIRENFDLWVQDDHTIALAVKEEISWNLPDLNLKGRYKAGFRLQISQREKPLETGPLTLNLQKKLPEIKAQQVTLNPHYKTVGRVSFTGATVTGLSENDAYNLPVALESDEEKITVRLESTPVKNQSGNLSVTVWTEEYQVPVPVTIPVRVETKAPAFRLEKTSLTLSSLETRRVTIPIQCTTKGVDMEDMLFRNVRACDSKGEQLDGFEVFLDGKYLWFGAIDAPRAAGKQTISIRFDVIAWDAEEAYDEGTVAGMPMELKLTLVNQDPVVKLDRSSLTLNAVRREDAYLGAYVTGLPSFQQFSYDYTVQGRSFKEAKEFFTLTPCTEDPTGDQYLAFVAQEEDFTPEEYQKLLKDTFTVSIGIAGTEPRNWAKLTVKLTEAKPGISLRASGSLDLNRDDSYVTLTPTYRNAWGSRECEVTVTDSAGNSCDAISTYTTPDGQILLLRNLEAEMPSPGKYRVTVSLGTWGEEETQIAASAAFRITQGKPSLKAYGKLDSFLEDSYVEITSGYRRAKRSAESGQYEFLKPTITVWTTGKKPEELDSSLYSFGISWMGTVRLWPITDANGVIPAGKYTVELDYGDGTVLSTTFRVTQTPTTLRLNKSTVTLHPGFDAAAQVETNCSTLHRGAIEFYQANGKTPWADQELITAAFEGSDISLGVKGNVNVPEKDTTVKLKLTPDTRVPGKFTWLTVKVLGRKNLNRKITVKASNSLDPSLETMILWAKYSISGFDNSNVGGTSKVKTTAVLQVSRDRGRSYQNLDEKFCTNQPFVSEGEALLAVRDAWDAETGKLLPALDPSLKYRLKVTFGDPENPIAEGTGDVKVAYGANKFTVDRSLTLYRADARAVMNLRLNTGNEDQQIDHVTLKGNTGFVIEGSGYDYRIVYQGKTPEKLKSTTLTLQIFLKGNQTAKPNATANVRLTVK